MEIWKDIYGYERLYQISNYGRVKSLPRITNRKSGRILSVRERVMANIISADGYLRIKLCKNNIQKIMSIHRLVAIAFIANPKNKPQVNHIDGNKLNNKLENLEWVTAKENSQHAILNGLSTPRTNEKIPCIQVSLDGFILNEFESRSEASRITGASGRDISDCINKKLKTAGGYLWM